MRLLFSSVSLPVLVFSATATASAQNAQLVACVNLRSGSVRIESEGNCNRNEVPIRLGQGGAQGPAGPAGPQGPTGPVGPQGPAGPQGAQGTQGATGAPGAAGPQGATGAQGATGPQGPAGANGDAGPQGDVGPQGPQGATGPQGPAGANGNAGPQGAVGPQGLQGVEGPAGANGAVGPQGNPGPQGPQGPAGPGGDNGRTIIDASGVEIGIVELSTGFVSRKFGSDVVMLAMAPQGIAQAAITFYHTSANCTGPRYLWNNGGLFAYFGQYLGGSVFYTRLADAAFPPMAQTINSREVVNIGSDPMTMGSCTASPMGFQSMGPVVAVTDPALNSMVVPFRLK
jgi:hypothetical protein